MLRGAPEESAVDTLPKMRRRAMKRTIFGLATLLVVFVVAFTVLVLRPVPKVKAHRGCSNATLRGDYGLIGTGFYGTTTPVPANVSLLLNFDGRGGFSGSSVNFVLDGSPAPGNPYTFSGGTYTVNSDCTYTLSLTDFDATVSVYGAVVDNGGGEISGNVLSSNTNVTGTIDAKKVASEEAPGPF